MADIFVAKEEKKTQKKPTPKKTLAEYVKKSPHKIADNTHSPFSSFNYRPGRVEFETREKGEKVVLLLRKHPLTNIPWIFIAVVMIFAPVVLGVFPILSFLPSSFRFVAVLGWYLITSAFILENFFTWFFDVNIITDERIVDIDFSNLIYKQVSDANIDRIQDVTYKMGGAIRSLFNYGDVLVQTAGEEPNFEFLAIPKPDRVARILQDLRIEEEEERLAGRRR